MTAHLSDSDRQALRLAQDLREQMRLALPQQSAAPSVSPFVDPSGRPSVLMRMDDETARALMAVLSDRLAAQAQPQQQPMPQQQFAAEPRRADGSHAAPPPPTAAPPQQPEMSALPHAPAFTPAPAVPAPGGPLFPTAFPAR
ncbi:hypothetical protein Acsp04_47790 [Actinomadura sp. NBRC 104425]|uniref:hypothetical protein n=1 Tax=Actinomadura sp. NBRC 104425 TaxID=3032204 RepID=UPI0024A022C5|nr:hypothetical protein [Actinomadura sp. NBRC 104425]GLZ14544.1 hypothetical protein Acsp04_47790 [Actinomadura sp. NBRC 104425]